MTFVQVHDRRVSCVTFLSGSGVGNITVIGDPLTIELLDASLEISLEPASYSADLGDASLVVALSESSISVTLEPAEFSVEISDGDMEVILGC